MNSERIKEIQAETAYPQSRSVQQALLKVWNECEQKQNKNTYSEEEVLELLKNFNQNAMEYIKQDDRNIMTSVTLQKWFEQSKNK